jgi:hypothetical protein
MPNFNDAKITSLYVAQTGVTDIEDDAPNAPAQGPFSVTLEMVAGGAVAGPYSLVTSCSDLSETAPAPAVMTPAGALNGAGAFAAAPWVSVGPEDWVFNQAVTIPLPDGAGKGHVYQYTAALTNPNGQIVSIRQSDPFILL